MQDTPGAEDNAAQGKLGSTNRHFGDHKESLYPFLITFLVCYEGNFIIYLTWKFWLFYLCCHVRFVRKTPQGCVVSCRTHFKKRQLKHTSGIVESRECQLCAKSILERVRVYWFAMDGFTTVRLTYNQPTSDIGI